MSHVKRFATLAVASVALIMSIACNGVIVGGVGPGAASTGSGGGGGPSAPTPRPDAAGNLPYVVPTAVAPGLEARVWRLTHAEYRTAVMDFLGVAVDTSAFDIDNESGAFENVSSVGFVRIGLAGAYYRIAEQVAGMLTDAQLRTLAAPCGNLTTACKADFINSAVRRAFRRAPIAEDMTDLGDTFDMAVVAGDALLPFRAVVQQILTSPYFLYRTEVGAPEDLGKPAFRITNQEVASLLSFSLLGRPPSADLLGAADRGELLELTSLRSRVQTLLAMPEAAVLLRSFLGQWMMLNKFQDETLVHKFPEMFPNFSSVRGAMVDEANSFLSSRGGMTSTLAQLLMAPVPPATGALGTFYSSLGTGAGTRTGWMGLGAFLSTAAHSDIGSPTLRGLFIRDRMLCQTFVVPPDVPNLTDVEAMGAAPKSTRDLYQIHKVRADCAACHDAIDPVGFVFESFDGAGRYRTQELFRNQTVPVTVDTSGRLINTDVNRDLTNHADLAQALASSAWVRECAAIQTFRFFMGVGGDVPRGLPPVMAGYQSLTTGGTMKDLVAAVMASESTIQRIRN